MYIVIPMAGEGRRFRDAGYDLPKYQISANGKFLFDWAIESLSNFFKEAEFIFILREKEDFVVQRCEELGIEKFRQVVLSHKTDGQATTVMLGLDGVAPDRSILIFNIDTHVIPKRNAPGVIDGTCDGWLQFFKQEGSHWSFGRLDSEGWVTEVAEKKRISEFACTGMYFFRSTDLFKRIYLENLEEVKSLYSEAYVAPFYQFLIEEGARVGSQVIETDEVIPLGTPDEVAAFDCNFGKDKSIPV